LTGRSAISRRFVKQTETAQAELMTRDLTAEDIKVLMLDGDTWPSVAWWWRWGSPPAERKSRSGCGTAPRRTRPWCARCWLIWSSVA
jgi:hypothetical protein